MLPATADLGSDDPPEPESTPGGVLEDGAQDAATEKLAAQVARRIESHIIDLGWPVGSVLGSEPELRERYGVSRAVLREAVRLTEHHQVTRMRRGSGGGLVVAAPDAGPAMRALVIYLEYVGLSVADLIEARLLLEPIAAASAAERVSEEDIAELRQIVQAEVEHREEPDLDGQDRLHVQVARMSGNPVLELFVDVLTRLTADRAYVTRKLTKAEIAEAKDRAHERHEAIAGAITAGDGSRAAAEVADHLKHLAAWLLSKQSQRRRASPRVPRPDSGAKLAEPVAAGILAEIVRRNWPIGLVLGSESDLLARYGISRSVLREAVRILEYHSVARMRRGPGGGLVVTEPEADASIEAMALYLDYRKVSPEDLIVAREAIELGAVRKVVARHDDPEVEEGLRKAIERTGEPSAPGRTGGDYFHVELVRLTGNPVLGLFLRILTELWTRHTAAASSPQPGADAVATVEAVHNRILEALLTGDEDLTRHRMRRHLSALTAWYD